MPPILSSTHLLYDTIKLGEIGDRNVTECFLVLEQMNGLELVLKIIMEPICTLVMIA